MKIDLNDDELFELEGLLAATPEPLMPVDAVMLDGLLCGVLVQPALVERERWLPLVFDAEGRPLPDDVDAGWLARCEQLVQRRMDVLARAIAEDGWFEPIVRVADEGDEVDPTLTELPEWSRPVTPWVAGFEHALQQLGDLGEREDAAVLVARLLRHLPPEDDEERALVQTLNREYPLTNLDDALSDLVQTVCELYELTLAERYAVDVRRRDAPKVGRNDPCPCGSGRKHKHCHGAA